MRVVSEEHFSTVLDLLPGSRAPSRRAMEALVDKLSEASEKRQPALVAYLRQQARAQLQLDEVRHLARIGCALVEHAFAATTPPPATLSEEQIKEAARVIATQRRHIDHLHGEEQEEAEDTWLTSLPNAAVLFGVYELLEQETVDDSDDEAYDEEMPVVFDLLCVAVTALEGA